VRAQRKLDHWRDLTPILVAANIDVGTGDSSPTWIDMAYLRKKGYLDKTAPEVAPASPPPQAMHEDDQEQTQDAPDDYAPERFFFEEYKAPRQTKGEREAHKRIGLLQGLGKFQGKAMRGLSRRRERYLRRSGSSSMAPRHAVRADPPRYSSFEPRQRESQEESTPLPKRSQSHRRKRKVQRPSPEADSTMELDDTSRARALELIWDLWSKRTQPWTRLGSSWRGMKSKTTRPLDVMAR
ncbi:hypothetical protein ISN45_Un76g000010, partial [Arabidopsis thaliana x Arabidopsis arenosa]